MTQKSKLQAKTRFKKSKRSRLALLALEPRLVFDGAMAVSEPDLSASDLDSLLVLPDSSVANSDHADHSDLDPAALASVLPGTGRELVVIDGAIYNAQTLIDDVRQDPSRTVLVLNPAGNEESQLTEFLGQHPGEFDAIHLMTHGLNGWLFLGTQALYLGDITGHAALWSRVGASLTPGGDLLLYGCKTAGVDATAEFIDQLAQFTGADIAASIDTTGSGGNWALEHRVGNVQATELQPASWQGNLAVALAVSNPSVSEASPYAMFTIKGNPSQTVTLTLGGTATGGATSSTAGADYVTTLETSADGATWTAGNSVTLSADGEAFVRLRIVNDTPYDNGETITLTATPSSGAAATGTATLRDDGTGYSFDGSLTLPVLDASSLSVSDWRDLNAAKKQMLNGNFHSAVYAAELGGYYVSGTGAASSGSSLTTPVLVTPDNGYNYTGDIISIQAVAGSGVLSPQFQLLTTDGLWVWGGGDKLFASLDHLCFHTLDPPC